MCPYRFQRIFVSVGDCIQVAFGCGIKFSAIYACHLRHVIYHSGRLHLLTTRDGNNKIVVLAWCYAETESADTYTYFAEQCHLAGLSRYLSESGIVFSDRQKGIQRFHDRFNSKVDKCFVHIIRNAIQKCRGTGTGLPEGLAWDLQKAETRALYDSALQTLRQVCPVAARYFDNIDNHEH